MPKVGKMKFPYSKKGMEDATNYAKQSGKPMQVEGNYMGGGKVLPKYQMGGPVNPGQRPPMPGQRPPMQRPPMQGAPMQGPPRPPMQGPPRPPMQGSPRPPMQRPPMAGQRPPMAGGRGQGPQMPQQGGPKPPMPGSRGLNSSMMNAAKANILDNLLKKIKPKKERNKKS
jgi:hypothetical protein